MADLLEDVETQDASSVGSQLQKARKTAGLELADIANQTRIPLRHLDAIEKDDFAALPSFTYAAGFVRAFARAVGADEVTLAQQLRAELGRGDISYVSQMSDEVADPARVPPRWLAWTAALVMLIVAGGYGLWRSALLTPETPLETSANVEAKPVAAAPAQAPPAQAAPAATGPVVLTATDDVWFRVYDRNDKVLFEGVKKKGETYSVPTDADTPMIRTGRADQIAVTIGGVAVPALGPAEMTVKDVVISAAGLSQRAAPSQASTPPASPQIGTVGAGEP